MVVQQRQVFGAGSQRVRVHHEGKLPGDGVYHQSRPAENGGAKVREPRHHCFRCSSVRWGLLGHLILYWSKLQLLAACCADQGVGSFVHVQ